MRNKSGGGRRPMMRPSSRWPGLARTRTANGQSDTRHVRPAHLQSAVSERSQIALAKPQIESFVRGTHVPKGDLLRLRAWDIFD